MAEVKPSVGLIGLGRWGKGILKPKLETYGNLAWACSGRSQEDYKNRLADTDWVFVATPTATHAQFVEEALTAGANVFCEKPLTGEIKEGRRLYDLADKKGKLLYVGDIFVWSDQVKKIKEHIATNGTPSQLDFTWRKWGTFGDTLWGALVYHDLTILDRIFGGIDNLEVTACRTNEYNVKHLEARINGVNLSLHYDRTQDKKIKPSKQIVLDGVVVYNSTNQQNDPLSEMIGAVLSGRADFDVNKRRTLATEIILGQLSAHYEEGIVPEDLDKFPK